jgi:ribosome-associated protein
LWKKWSYIHTESRPCASADCANDLIAGHDGLAPEASLAAAGTITPIFTRGVYEMGLMDGPLRVTRSVVVPERELRWRFSRSSGPGGQSVNTADSRVELSLDLTKTTSLGPVQRARVLDRLSKRLVDGVITVTASEHRSQLRNREAALERLAAILAKALAPPPPRRRPTTPRRGAVERRLADKKRRARTKQLRRNEPRNEED